MTFPTAWRDLRSASALNQQFPTCRLRYHVLMSRSNQLCFAVHPLPDRHNHPREFDRAFFLSALCLQLSIRSRYPSTELTPDRDPLVAECRHVQLNWCSPRVFEFVFLFEFSVGSVDRLLFEPANHSRRQERPGNRSRNSENERAENPTTHGHARRRLTGVPGGTYARGGW